MTFFSLASPHRWEEVSDFFHNEDISDAYSHPTQFKSANTYRPECHLSEIQGLFESQTQIDPLDGIIPNNKFDGIIRTLSDLKAYSLKAVEFQKTVLRVERENIARQKREAHEKAVAAQLSLASEEMRREEEYSKKTPEQWLHEYAKDVARKMILQWGGVGKLFPSACDYFIENKDIRGICSGIADKSKAELHILFKGVERGITHEELEAICQKVASKIVEEEIRPVAP